MIPDSQASEATNAAKDAAKNRAIEEQRRLQESAAQKAAVIGAMAPPEADVPEAGASSPSPSPTPQ